MHKGKVIFDFECYTHCRLRLATEDEIKYGRDLLSLHELSQKLDTMKVSHMCFWIFRWAYISIDIDQMQNPETLLWESVSEQRPEEI